MGILNMAASVRVEPPLGPTHAFTPVMTGGLTPISGVGAATTTPVTEWYRLSGDINVRRIERSFSVSVGNLAYPNRAVYWPGPCHP